MDDIDPELVAKLRASQWSASSPLTEHDFAQLFQSHAERERFEAEVLARASAFSGEALPPCAVVVREGGEPSGEYWAFLTRMRLQELPEEEEDDG